MSFSAVRSYFRTRMDSLGFDEWTDGFNFENIPATIIDGSYHIESGQLTPTDVDQHGRGFECEVVVRLFVSGYRDPASGIDTAISYADDIMDDIMDAGNRLGSVVKDIYPGAASINPFSGSNDNGIILEMPFVAKIFKCFVT